MIRNYLPIAVTVCLIVVLTLVEARFSDRFRSTNVDAAEFGQRFDHVPQSVGLNDEWVGEDVEVTDDVIDVAGAVRHVNRMYTNNQTGHQVGVWLIVGHSRDICRHTPDICYPNQGFRPIGRPLQHTIVMPNGENATFLTCKFQNESSAGVSQTRVFWAWNGNEEGKMGWEAPDSQRIYYGNNRALYKLYFTTAVTQDEDEISDSIIHREFARLMLPEINKALFPEIYGAVSSTDDASSADDSLDALLEGGDDASDAEADASESSDL